MLALTFLLCLAVPSSFHTGTEPAEATPGRACCLPAVEQLCAVCFNVDFSQLDYRLFIVITRHW